MAPVKKTKDSELDKILDLAEEIIINAEKSQYLTVSQELKKLLGSEKLAVVLASLIQIQKSAIKIIRDVSERLGPIKPIPPIPDPDKLKLIKFLVKLIKEILHDGRLGLNASLHIMKKDLHDVNYSLLVENFEIIVEEAEETLDIFMSIDQ